MKVVPRAQGGLKTLLDNANLNEKYAAPIDNTRIVFTPKFKSLEDARRMAEIERRQKEEAMRMEQYINTPLFHTAGSSGAKLHTKLIDDYNKAQKKLLLEQAGPLGGLYITKTYDLKGLPAAREAANITRGVTEAVPRMVVSTNPLGLAVVTAEGFANAAPMLASKDSETREAGLFGLAMSALPILGVRPPKTLFPSGNTFTATNGIKIRQGSRFARNSASGEQMLLELENSPSNGIWILWHLPSNAWKVTPTANTMLTNAQKLALVEALQKSNIISDGELITTSDATFPLDLLEKLFKWSRSSFSGNSPVYIKPTSPSILMYNIPIRQKEWMSFKLTLKPGISKNYILDALEKYKEQGLDGARLVLSHNNPLKIFTNDLEIFKDPNRLNSMLTLAEKHGFNPQLSESIRVAANNSHGINPFKKYTYKDHSLQLNGSIIKIEPNVYMRPKEEGNKLGEFSEGGNYINIYPFTETSPASTAFHELMHWGTQNYLNNLFYKAKYRPLLRNDTPLNSDIQYPHETPVYLSELGFNFGLNPSILFDDNIYRFISDEVKRNPVYFNRPFRYINFTGNDARPDLVWQGLTGNFKKGGKLKPLHI